MEGVVNNLSYGTKYIFNDYGTDWSNEEVPVIKVIKVAKKSSKK
jgi:hypothetical protein